MRDVLQRIRTRVDRLVAGLDCDGSHVLTHVSFMPMGEPVPDWPPADAAETCGICGAALEYHHIIHRQEASDASPRRSD